MATYNVRIAKSIAAITVSTVDTVNLSGGYATVEIINRSTTATDLLWCTVSQRGYASATGETAIPAATPSANGDDVYLVPAGPGHLVIDADRGHYFTQVKLFSAQTPGYTVQTYNRLG